MSKQGHITLNLDFNVEKAKLQEVGAILGKDLDKGIKNSKSLDYIDNARKSMSTFQKQVHGLYNELSKPLVSKAQAKELATSLGSAFTQIDSKLLSLQGNIGKTFNSAANTDAIKRIKALSSELDKLTADYQEISKLTSKSRNLGNKTDIKNQITNAQKELDILKSKQTLNVDEQRQKKELNKIIREGNKILEEKLAISEQIKAIQEANDYKSQAQLEGAIATKTGERDGLISGTIMPEEVETLNKAFTEMRHILSDIYATSNATVPKISSGFDEVVQAEKEAEMQAKSFKSILQELGIPMLSLHEIVGMLKQVISYSYDYLKNLDAALTEIAVVSDKTRAEAMKLTDTFIELSQKTGMAIDDIAQASTIFYQQGLGDEAVKKLSEYTAIFAKISGEDVPTAADQLTAAINGFGFAADDVASVVDKMSVLAAYSAADIDELATAMSKGASQAAMAGLTFDEYNAYLATMIETTREAPENLGTSLKTIMSRFQSIKTGDNTEDDTDVNDVEKALKSVGVQLRDSEGQLRELGDVLNELGPKWATLDRNTQAYLGTVIAGTRQQSRFISLMQNWDRALELTEASQNSAGAAARMHAKAMEGLEASLNTLTNAWQKLISNLANGDSFKWIIDGLASLVGWFGEGNTALKLFTSAVVIWNAKTLATNLSLAAQGKTYKNLDNTILTVVGRIKALAGNIEDLKDPMSKETSAIAKQTAEIREQIQAYRDLKIAKEGGVVNPNIATTGSSTLGNIANTASSATGRVSLPSGAKLSKNAPTGTIKAINTEGVPNLTKEVAQLGNVSKNTGGKLANLGGNVVGLLGQAQTAIAGFTLTIAAVSAAVDLFTTTAEEMKEKAQEAYDEKQDEIDKNIVLMQSIDANLDVYDKLSRKINKSSDELNQLAEAANALADAAPGALIGYDENGNAIIDVGAAKAEAKNAEAELVQSAKDQIANIGNLAKAELREQAENNYGETSHSKWTSAGSTTGKVMAGAGGAGMAVAGGSMLAGALGAASAGTAAAAGASSATVVGLPAGVVLGVAAAVLALGAAVVGLSESSKEAAIDQEQYNLAVEKASQVSKENMALLLQNMSYITNAQVRDNTVDGVSVSDRTNMANYIGNEWIQQQTNDLFNQLATGEIDEDEYEEAYKNLGQKWENLLEDIDDRALASAYTNISKIAENIGDKTYGEVESSIESLIKNDMGIKESDPLFETLKTAFTKAAYSGTGTGIYGVLDELESSRKKDMKKAFSFGNGDPLANMRKVNEKYDKAESNVKNMTGNELDFYSNAGITNNVDLFNSMIDQYGPTIKAALVDSTEAATVQSIAILSQYRDAAIGELNKLAAEVGAESYEEINYDELSKKQKAAYDYWITMSLDASSSIENAWNSLDISIDIPWKQLWDDFEELTDRVRTTRETLSSLTSDEGIDPDQWKEFTTILDDIDFSAMDADQISQYADALDVVSSNLKVVNGQIYAEGKALETIADLEEAAIQASIQKTKVELMNKQIELEASKSIIDAQIATLEYQIAAAQGAANAEDLKIKAQNAWVESSNKLNTFYVQNQGKVTEAMVSQYSNAFAQIATKYNQLQTAMADGSINADEIGALQTEWQNLQKDLTFDAYSAEISGLDLSSLQSELTAAKKVASQYDAEIANIGLKLATLDSGLFYSENGVVGGDEASVEQYIGQLEEIYNMLRKIEGAENRLQNLEDYSSIARGEDYAKYLQERIQLTQNLTGEYQELLAAQKYIENTEQQAILNSPVGDVFSFDEFGNIIIDYEKYLKLQDESIDGKQSEKELADALYDEYQEIHSTTQEYYDNLIANIERAIDAQQELVDTYVDQEHDLAEAVKEIYQDMLDNKLEAIDKEIEALEKLKEARDDANKARDNSRELSKMQTGLKRSMMDTSGASNTKVLNYQDQIQAKLEEMGEDEYTKRMDSIKEALDEQKEQLQRNFDEFFEDYEALYDLIESRILTSEEAVIETLKTTEEYLHASDAERAQLISEWSTRYETAMSATANGGTIMDVVNSIFSLQDSMPDIDATLQNHDFASDVGTGVSRALAEYFGSSDSGESGGSGSGGGGGYTTSATDEMEVAAVEPTGGVEPLDTTDLEETASWWSTFKESAGSWWENLKNGFVSFFTETLPNFISSIPEKLGELAASIVNFLIVTVPNAIVNFVTVTIPNAIAAIGKFFTETLPAWFEGAKQAVITFFTETIPTFFTETLPNAFMSALEAIGNFFVGIKDAVVNKIKEIADGIKNLFGRFWTSFTSNLSDEAKERLEAIGEWIKGLWQGIKDGISAVKDWVVDKVTGLVDGAKEKFNNLKEAIAGTWQKLKDGASEAWQGIKDTFAKIPEWFKEKFAAAWTAVKNVFSTGGKIFDGIKDGIVSAFKTVVNGIIGGINKIIKMPFDGINGLLNTIRDIDILGVEPFKNLWKKNPLSVPQIPQFLHGGMANFTGPAWLDGTKSAPEAVLNASQTKAFLKLADNLDKIEGGSFGGNNVVIENISFNVDSMSSPEDGEKAFDAFVNRFKEIGSQTGLSFSSNRL